MDQYEYALQQVLQLEILNHEDSDVQILKTHQTYGNCGHIATLAEVNHSVMV